MVDGTSQRAWDELNVAATTKLNTAALRGATSADHLAISLLINDARTADQSETSNPTIV